MDYLRYAGLCKALSDEKRLKIVDMLSCGELCACEILQQFDFTQSALSQQMKVLVQSGLVAGERRGAWMHYSLNAPLFAQLLEFLQFLYTQKENCICKEALSCK